jgi:hypothetical protein
VGIGEGTGYISPGKQLFRFPESFPLLVSLSFAKGNEILKKRFPGFEGNNKGNDLPIPLLFPSNPGKRFFRISFPLAKLRETSKGNDSGKRNNCFPGEI